jgi:CheY-like chemotaxis protein
MLLVEDEDSLRAAIRRLLQVEGYTVLEAQNGTLALQVLAGATAGQVDLVLTDLRMPVMDGRQLAAAPSRVRPTLPIPFRNDDLLATIRSRLGETT